MKTAIVTGSGSGIGRAVAIRLAADGYRVTANDILLDQAESVATSARDRMNCASTAAEWYILTLAILLAAVVIFTRSKR